MHSVWSCYYRGMCHYERHAGKGMADFRRFCAFLYDAAWMTPASCSFNIVDTGFKHTGNVSKDKTMISQKENKIIWQNCQSASCQEVSREQHPFCSFLILSLLSFLLPPLPQSTFAYLRNLFLLYWAAVCPFCYIPICCHCQPSFLMSSLTNIVFLAYMVLLLSTHVSPLIDAFMWAYNNISSPFEFKLSIFAAGSLAKLYQFWLIEPNTYLITLEL